MTALIIKAVEIKDDGIQLEVLNSYTESPEGIVLNFVNFKAENAKFYLFETYEDAEEFLEREGEMFLGDGNCTAINDLSVVQLQYKESKDSLST